MGFMETLFGGSSTKYKGGYNPNQEIFEDIRKPILDALQERFGGMIPADKKLSVSYGGNTVSREHPDVAREWDRLMNLAGWGPIENPHPESSSGPGLLSLLGLGLSLV